MRTLSAVARLFAGLDQLLERAQSTWWGAVITDSRYPDVHDLNYARVDTAQPDLTLEEVEEALLPALHKSGASHFHVVVFEPDGCANLLGQLDRSGHPLSWDTVMRLEAPLPHDESSHAVEAIPPGDELWRLLDGAFREFGLHDPNVRGQVLAWNREVLAPAGRRWFAVRGEGEVTGMGSIHVVDHVGYVDDMLTLPAHRRRGIASAVVRRLVHEAADQGAEDIILLADRPDPIRLYRSLGFEERLRLASALSRLGGPGQARGSSGSEVGSTDPPAAPGAGSPHGVDPG